jgi:SAM-dependent methyltransferase
LDERPWYSGFFDDDYLRVFDPVVPQERTAAEVNGVVGQLGLAPGARLLDLCCGQGRHTVPLARLGFRVTGLDLLHPDGRRTSHDTSIRLYTLTELEAMLDRAGLELLAVSGDLDGGPLELDSGFVVTLSGRPGKGIS